MLEIRPLENIAFKEIATNRLAGHGLQVRSKKDGRKIIVATDGSRLSASARGNSTTFDCRVADGYFNRLLAQSRDVPGKVVDALKSAFQTQFVSHNDRDFKISSDPKSRHQNRKRITL